MGECPALTVLRITVVMLSLSAGHIYGLSPDLHFTHSSAPKRVKAAFQTIIRAKFSALNEISDRLLMACVSDNESSI